MGRPSKPFDQEIADYICERLASSRDGLETILAERYALDKDSPSYVIIYRWIAENKAFHKQYSRAREIQADYFGDLIVQEAFTARIGEKTRKGGKQGDFTEVGDNVERSRLICSTLLKRMSQLNPKKYGDHPPPDGGTDRLNELVSALRGS
jgi:hypothetical protein